MKDCRDVILTSRLWGGVVVFIGGGGLVGMKDYICSQKATTM